MMKNAIISVTATLAALLASGPAFAGDPCVVVPVPEPVTMSLLAGGILAIAAVKGMRRK